MANVYQQLLHVTGDLLYPVYRVLAQGAVYSLEVQEVEGIASEQTIINFILLNIN